MGNAQSLSRRERTESGSGLRKSGGFSDEDQCPVQLKISKSVADKSLSTTPDRVGEYPVVVKWTGSAKQVFVGGSWDGWKRKLPMVRSHEDFITIINLPEGRHEFKFYVDGNWTCDSNLPKTDNPLGSENNVLVIDRADYEVFDALEKDQADSHAASNKGSVVSSDSGQTGDSYCQDIPDRHAFEKAHQPPVLPPHLLQVILNKDTPISCDPNVLPEPNHVMLNHLYALSIKDGVMVLSATHRYRKKYVTTLLYKPI